MFAASEEAEDLRGSAAQEHFVNGSRECCSGEADDCGTAAGEDYAELDTADVRLDTELEDSQPEEAVVAEAVRAEARSPEAGEAAAPRTSEGRQLMASVDRVMSYG